MTTANPFEMMMFYFLLADCKSGLIVQVPLCYHFTFEFRHLNSDLSQNQFHLIQVLLFQRLCFCRFSHLSFSYGHLIHGSLCTHSQKTKMTFQTSMLFHVDVLHAKRQWDFIVWNVIYISFTDSFFVFICCCCWRNHIDIIVLNSKDFL